jgi:segregation and condensation protein A
MPSFAVKQAAFSGPLGLLLELLDKRELEIADVSLASIADEYLGHLDREEVPHDELADFLLVASRLIYLKSKALMPFLVIEEEDEAVGALEDQLRAYRLFAEAATRLEEQFNSSARSFVAQKSRVVKEERQAAFRPAKNIERAHLRAAFGAILKRLAPFFALAQAQIERVQSVEDRLEELTSVLKTRATLRFKDITKGAVKRVDVVVSFLALLELVRRKTVRAKMDTHDIIIERL